MKAYKNDVINKRFNRRSRIYKHRYGYNSKSLN